MKSVKQQIASTVKSIKTQIYCQTYSKKRKLVWCGVWNQVELQVWYPIEIKVWDQVAKKIRNQLKEQI